VERLEIIEALKKLPDRIEAEMVDLTDAVMRRRPAEGEWCINEVIGHLNDMVRVWHGRLYQVWAQNDPLFSSFDGEASVIEEDYLQSDWRRLLVEIRQERTKTVDLLTHAVDWSRLGQQRGVGRRTLKQFAEFVVSHDEDHLQQIRTLKAWSASAITT
jgi:hypothetical protein